MNELYLFYDSETGGLDAEYHSLLTAWFGLYTRNDAGKYILQRELDLRIKPNAGDRYRTTKIALECNRIDLQKHDNDPRTVTVTQAAKMLYMFLHECTNGGEVILEPGGHNEPFDHKFVTGTLLIPDIFHKFVKPKAGNKDTMILAKSKRNMGKLDLDSLKLEKLAAHFKITVPESDWHTAKGDTNTYVQVLECLESL